MTLNPAVVSMFEKLHSRRILLSTSLLSLCSSFPLYSWSQDGAQPKPQTAEEWLEEALTTRALSGPLNMSRFVEPMYILLDPGFIWEPNPDNGKQFHKIVVPGGFVTDLASIPRALFSILRPDGDYAQAAIVHDYLYWTQTTTRKYADEVFRVAMRDLEVAPRILETIYFAVRTFGQDAWDENSKLKRGGEKRFLKKFPKEAKTRWQDWKQDSANFFADVR